MSTDEFFCKKCKGYYSIENLDRELPDGSCICVGCQIVRDSNKRRRVRKTRQIKRLI